MRIKKIILLVILLFFLFSTFNLFSIIGTEKSITINGIEIEDVFRVTYPKRE